MLKKLLAGLMAALTAGTGSGAATQADQFAENFVQEYVSDMEAGMDHVWDELNYLQMLLVLILRLMRQSPLLETLMLISMHLKQEQIERLSLKIN